VQKLKQCLQSGALRSFFTFLITFLGKVMLYFTTYNIKTILECCSLYHTIPHPLPLQWISHCK